MKQILNWHLCLAIWLGIASLSCAQNKAAFELADDEKLIEFTTDRFTLPNLHVTPDGKSIIFDVLGDIYQVPIEGGKAEVLLQDNHWKRAGKLSPDGKTLAYVSDETGEFQVWTCNLRTQVKQVYPVKEYLHFPLYGYWSSNGSLLIPSAIGLLSYNISNGKETLVRPAKEEEKSILHTVNWKMTVGANGDFACFTDKGALWAFDIIEEQDLFIGNIPNEEYISMQKLNPSGNAILYYKNNDSITVKEDLMYWNLRTNETNRVTINDYLGHSTLLKQSFDFIDENTIVLDKEGEVVQMNIETGEYEPIPIEVEVKKVIKKPLRREPQYIRDSIITASVLRNPVTRKDLDTIYFGAFGKLHSYAKRTHEITEVYPDEDRFEVSPSLSPDGKYLAYTTWNDIKMGNVFAREIKTGKEYQLTKTPGRYINPVWSPNGRKMAFIQDDTEAQIGNLNVEFPGKYNKYGFSLVSGDLYFLDNIDLKNAQIIKSLLPKNVLPNRFFPVPVFSKSESKSNIFISTYLPSESISSLIEIDLLNKEILTKNIIPFHTDEVLIAPDQNHIAFIYDEQVWVDSYPYSKKFDFSINSNLIPERYHYCGGYLENVSMSSAKSVYELAPSYLYWQDEFILMWGSAEEIYQYDIRTKKTEKIAEIKVQKPRAVPKTQYALTNVRIITMNKQDEIIGKGTILIKDNRIEKVGEKIMIPENYKIFDLEGKTIIPGLIDVHAHYLRQPYELPVQSNYKFNMNLAYGITSVYDPSVNVLDYREQAQMVETGQVIGPRIFGSGNIIMYMPIEYDFKKIKDEKDAERIILSNKKLGVSGPIKEYALRDRKYRKWLRKAAEKYNNSITAHQHNYINAMTRVIDGYSAQEHVIGSFKLQKDVSNLLLQSKINLTSTLITKGGLDLLLKNEIRECPNIKSLLDINDNSLNLDFSFISDCNKMFEEKSKKADINNDEFIYQKINDLQNIIENNGAISVGAHGENSPGLNTHWELWTLTLSGLSNYNALKSGTIIGAEKLDLQEELGSIEKGKLADLVVLNEDPISDIIHTTEIYATIINGELYYNK